MQMNWDTLLMRKSGHNNGSSWATNIRKAHTLMKINFHLYYKNCSKTAVSG